MKKNYYLFLLFSVIYTITAIGQTPGNSLHFDGSNDYVSTSLPTVFSNINTSNITIETWIKPQTASFSRVVFAQLNSTNFMSISTGGSNQIYFYINNAVGVNTGSTLPLNQWTHVACVWVGSTQQTEIYFNGILQATVNGGSSSTGNDNLMTIGSRTNGAQYFNGELDELRIWDVRRTPCDINSSMNSEFTQSQANLVAYYNFNQGVAGGNNPGVTSLPDFTTNYNGTLNNYALTGTTSNWLNSGAIINQNNQNNGSVQSTDTYTTCDSLLWIDGNTYTSSNNTATHTITNGSANGCDSIITLNLTINNSVSNTIGINICNNTNYTYADGTISNNITANESHTSILTGASSNMCDSILTENLTVLPALTGSVTDVLCDGDSVVVNGTTYNAGNLTGTEVFTNVGPNNCDSTVTVNITVLAAKTGTVSNAICDGDSMVINGTTYNAGNPTGTEIFTNVGPSMCDSTVTVNLTINPKPTVAIAAFTPDTVCETDPAINLPAGTPASGTYSGSGVVGTTFDPNTAGVGAHYVVYSFTDGNTCTAMDSTMIVVVSCVGVDENGALAGVNIYPNPTNNIINITLGTITSDVNLTLTSVEGKIVYQENNVSDNKVSVDLSNNSKGIYFLKVETNNQYKVYKVIKE